MIIYLSYAEINQGADKVLEIKAVRSGILKDLVSRHLNFAPQIWPVPDIPQKISQKQSSIVNP